MSLATLSARINEAYAQGRCRAALDMTLLLMDSSFVALPFKDEDKNQEFVDGIVKAVQDQRERIKELTANYNFLERWIYKRGYRSVT